MNELFKRSPKDFHGVFCFSPNEENELKNLKEFREAMAREENRKEFTSIFQVAQGNVDDKLLKMLKSPPDPLSSSFFATEASTGSDDPAAALVPSADVPVSKSKKKKLTADEKKLLRRCGDEKRKHVIMSELHSELHNRVEIRQAKGDQLADSNPY